MNVFNTTKSYREKKEESCIQILEKFWNFSEMLNRTWRLQKQQPLPYLQQGNTFGTPLHTLISMRNMQLPQS